MNNKLLKGALMKKIMQDLIVKPTSQVPDKVDELHQFILIGKEMLKAHKAKIRAIEKIKSAKAAREAALADTQDIADILLDAEVKLGKILERIKVKPKSDSSGKGTFGGSEKTLPDGIDKKDSHYAQEMARHEDVVEKVKEIAREEGKIPTRADVMAYIHTAPPKTSAPSLAEIHKHDFDIGYELLKDVIISIRRTNWVGLSKEEILDKLEILKTITGGQNV